MRRLCGRSADERGAQGRDAMSARGRARIRSHEEEETRTALQRAFGYLLAIIRVRDSLSARWAYIKVARASREFPIWNIIALIATAASFPPLSRETLCASRVHTPMFLSRTCVCDIQFAASKKIAHCKSCPWSSRMFLLHNYYMYTFLDIIIFCAN